MSIYIYIYIKAANHLSRGLLLPNPPSNPLAFAGLLPFISLYPQFKLAFIAWALFPSERSGPEMVLAELARLTLRRPITPVVQVKGKRKRKSAGE